MALDVAGLSPGVGIIPDVINAIAYTIEGDFANAGISGLSAIPLLGQVTTISKISEPFFKTAKEAVTAAKKLGWKRVKGVSIDSHGQAVFKKGNKYYTRDVDGHKGGAWKEFDLKRKREATLDENLKRIGK
ncbi:hypothetical protein BGC33_02185 [Bathymodiolus thermophilus thioautotrophic gill symbiont]|uniref:Novel toxin 21 domain-containing protein n=2 Tax=Bathymodiolus thermophilus thioautotrophic gill symbiont TaxID=2360 RepID=A0A1J5U574_9GAMM|nr:hypothetical protein BGC33_02185 [Bathymodiolus thermophilus thioautotrophic gill symbiont]